MLPCRVGGFNSTYDKIWKSVKQRPPEMHSILRLCPRMGAPARLHCPKLVHCCQTSERHEVRISAAVE